MLVIILTKLALEALDMRKLTDEELRAEAKKRLEFKTHASTYVIINISIWILYYISGGRTSPPWPVWATFGWGIGLAFHYMGVYHISSIFSVEKEMEKLKAEKEKEPRSS